MFWLRNKKNNFQVRTQEACVSRKVAVLRIVVLWASFLMKCIDVNSTFSSVALAHALPINHNY